MNDAFLFDDAHAALSFAFHYAHRQHVGSPLGKLWKPSSEGGKGLSGVDGAAQAGMIRAEAERSGHSGYLSLIARYAPKRLRCDCGRACCSGYRANEEWQESVAVLGDLSIRALSGCVSNRRLRVGIVRRYFGERIKLAELAGLCGVAENTASAHNGKIARYLREIESAAWLIVSDRLISAEIVKNEQAA